MFLYAFVLLLCVILMCTAYVKHKYKYWQRRHVVQLKPLNFPFGNGKGLFTQQQAAALEFKKFYDRTRAENLKYAGILVLTSPSFVVVDPEIIKCVLTKDFQYFMDRGFPHDEKNDPLTATLLALEGKKWKDLRAKLTPTFTSGKMKMMFESVVQCSEPFQQELENCVRINEAVNIKDLFSCYTIDVIGSCAFGLDCNSFKDKDHQFRKYAYKAFEQSVMDNIRGLFVVFFPKLAAFFGLKMTNPDVENFFMKIITDTVKFRQSGENARKDFMQLLIQLLDEKDGITINELAAQCFLFFLAGFETSATTATFCLYELTQHQEIQDKVRGEVTEVLNKYDGKLSYDAIHEMKFMGQVLEETLRKYPPLAFLNRKCTKDYTIPGTDTTLEKGTSVLISTLGLHYDPQHFPNPEEFDPERFSEENKHKIAPFTYMPFGDGPRVCIGLRFAVMQLKVGLAALLKNFKFLLNEKTKVPLVFDPKASLLSPEGGIWVDVAKI